MIQETMDGYKLEHIYKNERFTPFLISNAGLFYQIIC